MLFKLKKLNNQKSDWNSKRKEKQAIADESIGKALHIYFQNQGIKIPDTEVSSNGISS